MHLAFSRDAWDDYIYWEKNDSVVLKKINLLIKECLRTPYSGTGKPDALKFSLRGCYSRRINSEHRLVYKVIDSTLVIVQCRYHY